MKKLTKLILTLCVLCALCGLQTLTAKSQYATKDIYYELILDFGDDYVFIHEVTRSKAHCHFRATVIMAKEDNVKAYCMKRVF